MNTFRRVSEATPAGDINESPVPPAANILSTKLLAKKIFRLYSDIWYREIFQNKYNIGKIASLGILLAKKKQLTFLVSSLYHEGNLFGYLVFATERAIHKFAEWILSQKLSFCFGQSLRAEAAGPQGGQLNNNKFANTYT